MDAHALDELSGGFQPWTNWLLRREEKSSDKSGEAGEGISMGARARFFEKKKRSVLQKAFAAEATALRRHPLYGCFDWEKAEIYDELSQACGGDMLVEELMSNRDKDVEVDGVTLEQSESGAAGEDVPLWVSKVQEYTTFTGELAAAEEVAAEETRKVKNLKNAAANKKSKYSKSM